ncbi:MAG TPA: phage tail protein [Myxococcales bacterium]|jgi:phage tail-like protein
MQKRDRPYAQFNFWVNLGGGGDPLQPDAGFQEISALGMEVGVAEYRYGNHKLNNTLKVTGLGKSADVTFKRGVMGSNMVYEWFDKIRNGKNETRTVTIQLRNEENSDTVQSWVLNGARVIKFTTGPLNAKSNEIAMEELTLSFERMEVQ